MRIIKIFGIAVGAVVTGTAVTLFVRNLQRYAETTINSDDKDLLTRRYNTAKDISVIVEDIKNLLSKQTTYGRDWRVVDSKIENNSAVIKAEVPVVIFTDDLKISLTFEPLEDSDSGKNEIVLNIYSASRVGNSDFGENRRHIKQILRGLDFHFSDY